MSYILDALKKMEQEKTTKSRSAGKINITGELFGGERSQPKETSRLKIVLLFAVAILLTSGATWFLLKGPGDADRSTVIADSGKQTSGAKIPSQATAVPVAAQPMQSSAAIVPQAPLTQSSTPLKTKPTEPVSIAKSVVPDADEDVDEVRHNSGRQATRKSISAKTSEAPAPKYSPAPAGIIVSGIAWQDERNARRAVVNGFLLREGAVVSGAKIAEILQDRVRFSLSGTLFEVALVSSGLPGAGK